MFEICVDPEKLSGLSWLSCYITTPKHLNLFYSVGTVLLLLLLTAPTALLFGFIGAVMARSKILVIKVIGNAYISIVRGVPDIAFFLFFVIALDQLFEWVRHKFLCPEWSEPIRQGNDFVVCTIAKLPLNSSPQWIHEIYGFLLAVFTFAIVFGAFAANVLYGAMRAVPKTQIETAVSFGMTEQNNTFLSMILLFCYIGTGGTFLAKAAILPSLTHQSLNEDIPKSFHYAEGLIEGAETILFMFLCLLLPNLFTYFASIFIMLCLTTIVFRIIVCYKELN